MTYIQKYLCRLWCWLCDWWKRHDLLAKATTFLALATFLLSFLSWCQLRDFRDEEARRLRAYVALKILYPPLKNYGADQAPVVSMFLENVGQTPPYDLRWQSALTPGQSPETGPVISVSDCDVIMRDPKAHKSFFGREASFTKTASTPLTGDDIQAIKEHHKALYFGGRVCYRDIFGAQHWMLFCQVWAGEGNGLGTPTSCDYGNDVDRDPQ